MDSKLVGFAAALLGFASWTITSTIADRLASRQASIERAVAQQQMDEKFSALQLAQRNLMKLGTRLETGMLLRSPEAQSSDGTRVLGITSRLLWNEIAAEDISATSEFARQVEAYAATSGAEPALRANISRLIARIDSLAGEYWAADEGFQKWFGNRRLVIGPAMDPMLVDTLEQRQTEYSAVVERVSASTYTAHDELLEQYDALLRYQTERLARTRPRVEFLKSISALLLSAGTILGIVGKTLELRERRATPPPPSAK